MKIVGGIVIPAYQSANTIERALISISKSLSGADPIEVIVVFDGADSESEAIHRSWKDTVDIATRSLTVEHAGVATARNLGALELSARNIAFLDCDDEFTEERMKALLSNLSGRVIFGRQEIIAESGAEYQASIVHPSEFHLMSFVMNLDNFRTLGGFSEDYGPGAEWDFAIRAREFGLKLEQSDEVFIKRHINTKNASHQNPQVKSEHLKALREHLKRN